MILKEVSPVKKFICILLCIVLTAIGCGGAAFAAVDDKSDITDYPVIIVPGYSGSALVMTDENGEVSDVWGLSTDDILNRVLSRIAEIGIGLGASAFGNTDYIGRVVGEELIEIFEPIRCNDDGTSVYNVTTKYTTAEETNRANLFKIHPDGGYQHENEMMTKIAEYVGDENIYNFTCDFRFGAVACATRLDEYVQDVKAHSGKDKVNILAVSHGGQVTATYLSLFGYKQDVDNAVLTVPAIGGAALLYDLLSLNGELDELNLLHYIEYGMKWENDYHWLVEAQQLGFLDDIIMSLMPYAYKAVGNWTSLWDFSPADNYEDLKKMWLDPVKNAKIIETSDYMHNTVMPGFWTKLEKCENDYGINLTVIAGHGNSATSGWQKDSDGIIPTDAATGAYCAPFGERFADGYTQKKPCNGNYKVSPDMTIDASVAYLPDDTWFVDGLFHGMTYSDPFSRDLMITSLLTDEIKDVYSLPEYPQFHASTNPSLAVWAAFNNSTEGYLSSEDTALTVSNLSREGYRVRILGITCDGIDLDFKLIGNSVVEAGESIEISFSGDIPKVSKQRVSLTLSYCAVGSLTPIGERTMDFTLLNGENAVYDIENPNAPAAANNPIDKLLLPPVKTLLEKLGLYNLFSMFYTIIYTTVNSIIRMI